MSNRLRSLLQFQHCILKRYGWFRSWWHNKPIDANGEPLPWLTYPAIDFLMQFDFQGNRIFEWGSGFSTLWWHNQGAEVTTVESNPSWVPYIKSHLPSEVRFIQTAFSVQDEVDAIAATEGLFDVIVVDNNGPFRWRCCEVAPGKLAEGGIIILDNSDQCPKAWRLLNDKGFTAIDFSGFAPSNAYAQTTTIFFHRIGLRRRDICQPVPSVAQPNSPWPGC
jgi:hypothetical protein